MKIAIVAITRNGRKIARCLKRGFSKDEVYCFNPPQGKLKNLAGEIFDKDRFDGIVFIMALGIVVRIIARRLKDKYRDPAIVTVDEGAHFAISALSGHEGGANRLAVGVGNILGAQAVITTASESKKNILIGIGCRRGAKKNEIITAIRQVFKRMKLSLSKARYIATIDLKSDEAGLREASYELGVPLRIIAQDWVNKFKGRYQKSAFVKRKIGVWGVCEPCALLAGKRTKLILPKTILKGITVALAREY